MAGLIWQNLIHKKCPRCSLRLNEGNLGFGCSGEEKHFFISRQTMAKILSDPNHAALRFATEHEKDIVFGALKEMGVVVESTSKMV